jgi:hypothetical protein
MDNVLLFLFFDEENVEHLLFALPAVVSGFIFGSSVEPDLNAFAANELQSELRMTQSLHQDSPAMNKAND